MIFNLSDKVIVLVDAALRERGFHLVRWNGSSDPHCYLVQEIEDVRSYLVVFLTMTDEKIVFDIRAANRMNLVRGHDTIPKDGERQLVSVLAHGKKAGLEEVLYDVFSMLDVNAPILDRLAQIAVD